MYACTAVYRFGDIVLRPYRRDATGRLAQDRKDFEAKLTELQKRAMGGHLSRTEVSHLKLGRTLGEGNFGRVLAVRSCPLCVPCVGWRFAVWVLACQNDACASVVHNV